MKPQRSLLGIAFLALALPLALPACGLGTDSLFGGGGSPAAGGAGGSGAGGRGTGGRDVSSSSSDASSSRA